MANPLKLFLDQPNLQDGERELLCRNLFKRFHHRLMYQETPGLESPTEERVTESKATAGPEVNLKRKNKLIQEDEEVLF